VSLIARHLEANGIATVIIGSALDIVEHCGVPRFVYTDFPLGNPCGKPFDTDMQRQIVSAGIELLANAEQPRSTMSLPLNRGGDQSWRNQYMEIKPEDRAELARLGDARRAQRDELRADGQVREG
jgi:D-proline reductase (dithiol) PrdB